MNSLGTTNRQVFKCEQGVSDPERLELVYQTVLARLRALEQGQAFDPINVFPKPEPHTLKKISEGRVRLIFGVSVIDNIVSELLFGPWFQRMMDWRNLPFKIGWSPQRGGYRWLIDRLPEFISFADKSSWDWTVTAWEIDMVEAYFASICVGWDKQMRNHIRSVFGPLELKLARNYSVVKEIDGVMPSGTFFTISINSWLQVAVHRVVCLEIGVYYPDPFSMGDDTVQAFVPDGIYWDKWAEFGHVLKIIEHGKNWCEFAGHTFSRDMCYPAYLEKHAFVLQHLDSLTVEVQALLGSYQYLYAMDPPRFGAVNRRLVGTDQWLPHKQLLAWYQGWD